MDEESSASKEEPLLRPSCLTVTKSIKSRSSNCLTDPTITSWLPGFDLATQSTATNDWNIKIQQDFRPSKDEVSSQSNSNFGQWPSQRMSSDKQRLKGSRRKKRGKKQKKKVLDVEKGKDDDQLSPLGRKVIVFVAVFLFLLCILLVGVTLRLGPVIDEMVRKGNEEIYRSMTAGASTSPPTLEGAAVVNNTTPSSSTSG